MSSLNIKLRLTLWFVAIFMVIMLFIIFSQYWLTLSGLKNNIKKELDNRILTLDNLIVTSEYDPFDIAHIGQSDIFMITDDEKKLLTSELWDQNKIDSLPNDKIDKIFKINNKYYFLIKAEATNKASMAVYQSYSFLNDALNTGDSSILDMLKQLTSVKLHNIPESPKGRIYLFVVKDISPFQEVKINYLNNLLKIVPLVLILLFIAGYFMTRRFFSPLAQMVKKAHKISAEDLDARLPVKNPDDEFGKLAIVINNALSRIQDSFEKLRQFTANVSHELRTPLTAIRSVGEVTLKEESDINKYRDGIGSMLEEVDRLKCLIDKLLLLSRADAGKITVTPEKFSINEFINSIVETIKVIAEEKNVSFKYIYNDEFEVLAEKTTIRQALMNVLDNAIRYTPAGSFITINIGLVNKGTIYIDIIDQGPGIPLNERTKLFNRFYRIDAARSRETGGVGLGLAIAKWAIEVNKGTIEFMKDTSKGCNCRLTLPLYNLIK